MVQDFQQPVRLQNEAVRVLEKDRFHAGEIPGECCPESRYPVPGESLQYGTHIIFQKQTAAG
jgi:hypothetical protein